eukprot:gene84-biopygen3041
MGGGVHGCDAVRSKHARADPSRNCPTTRRVHCGQTLEQRRVEGPGVAEAEPDCAQPVMQTGEGRWPRALVAAALTVVDQHASLRGPAVGVVAQHLLILVAREGALDLPLPPADLEGLLHLRPVLDDLLGAGTTHNILLAASRLGLGPLREGGFMSSDDATLRGAHSRRALLSPRRANMHLDTGSMRLPGTLMFGGRPGITGCPISPCVYTADRAWSSTSLERSDPVLPKDLLDHARPAICTAGKTGLPVIPVTLGGPRAGAQASRPLVPPGLVGPQDLRLAPLAHVYLNAEEILHALHAVQRLFGALLVGDEVHLRPLPLHLLPVQRQACAGLQPQTDAAQGMEKH